MFKPVNFRLLMSFSVSLIISVIPLSISCQYEEFADSYSILSTVAGKGQLDSNGVIGWKAEFENGNAVDAELTRPHFAMADSAGNIYIADKDAHGIRKVSPDGKIKTIAGTNIAGFNGDGAGVECQLSSPNGLWVSKNGTVYILDLGNNKIRRLDIDGNLTTIVNDENGISLGRGIWVTETEDSIFYASGSQIKLWTQGDGIISYSSGYSGLGTIMLDKNGYLVATDRNANRVYRISKDGNEKESIAGNGSTSGGGENFLATETGLAGVRGVWFLDDNSYFVATHEGSQIWYIDVLGKIHLFLDGKDGDEYHSGDGENYRTPGFKISEPRGVSVDYNHNVLITENDYGYVRKIQNDYVHYYTGIFKYDNESKQINVFPNPADKELRIKYKMGTSAVVSLDLFDISGKKIKSILNEFQRTGNQEISLNIEDLTAGIYFIHFISAGQQQNVKIVINN